jgi:hypothetical protein
MTGGISLLPVDFWAVSEEEILTGRLGKKCYNIYNKNE